MKYLVLLLALASCISEKSNLIVLENQKEGTEDWLLTKVQSKDTLHLAYKKWEEIGLAHTTEIEAFCSETSVMHGDTLSVFVNTDPVSTFDVSIYRMGYYGGKGGRLMKEIKGLQGKKQPDPLEGEGHLIECQWEKTFDLIIPKDWLSGVYLGKMTTTLEGWQSYFIFIVKDDRKVDIVFQTSDLTWQAYNRWPEWRSLYDYQMDWGHNPWFTGIGPKVGFDRPYGVYVNHLPVNLEAKVKGSGEFLFWEFPLAFWLESKGYDVSYISNIDTHAHRELIMRGKGWLSVGHDEYWSPEMFKNVEYARDHGVNILFLSGNAVDGGIKIEKSNSGQPNRTYGRTGELDNEEALMGSTSYGVGLADWTVTKPDHWIFEGSGMKAGDGIKDLVGWEYHGYPLKEGVEVLAEGSLNGARPEDKYAAVYYETPSGSFVFNAATCWWSMMLSTPPGFIYPQNPGKLHAESVADFRENDERVQRITANLMDRISGK